MKFQNPSFKFFLNGRTNGRMDKRTDRRTDKPKAICSPLFQSWGHKNEAKLRKRTPLSEFEPPYPEILDPLLEMKVIQIFRVVGFTTLPVLTWIEDLISVTTLVDMFVRNEGHNFRVVGFTTLPVLTWIEDLRHVFYFCSHTRHVWLL